MFSALFPRSASTQRAIGFLEHFHTSQAAWVLVATGGSGNAPVATFLPANHGSADTWIASAQRQKRNILTLMAEPVAPVNNRMLVRGDLRAMRHFGIKLPMSGRAALDAFKPAPFLLLAAGRTIYAGWRLVAPVTRIEAVGDTAKAVAERLNGVSLGHLMPVGGTTLQGGELIELQYMLKDRLCLLSDFYQTPPRPVAAGEAAATLADIDAKPVTWLWPGIIAAGKLNLLGGLPDLGKSQVTLSVAATVSTGGGWPCEAGKAEPGGVLILTNEDDAEDTIKPRLMAAGADLRRVRVIDDIIDLREGIGPIVAAAARLGGVRLIIFDPLDGYVEGAAHTVRAALTPLTTWAAATSTALIAIVHPPKGNDGKTMQEWFSGSTAFWRMARTAWFVTPDPANEDRRLLLFAKGNVINDRRGHAYRFESVDLPGGVDTSRVVWDRARVEVTAQQMLDARRPTARRAQVKTGGQRAAAGRTTNPDGSTARPDAEEWLRSALANGPRIATELKREALAAGIGTGTLYRAAEKLGVAIEGEGNFRVSTWRL